MRLVFHLYNLECRKDNLVKKILLNYSWHLHINFLKFDLMKFKFRAKRIMYILVFVWCYFYASPWDQNLLSTNFWTNKFSGIGFVKNDKYVISLEFSLKKIRKTKILRQFFSFTYHIYIKHIFITIFFIVIQ